MALTRSALARAAGVAPSAVRYYERAGVLPEPARTAKGYRVYGPADVERLRFVRRAQELGFTLGEITGLLALAVSEGDPCDDVRARAEAHRADVANDAIALRVTHPRHPRRARRGLPRPRPDRPLPHPRRPPPR